MVNARLIHASRFRAYINVSLEAPVPSRDLRERALSEPEGLPEIIKINGSVLTKLLVKTFGIPVRFTFVKDSSPFLDLKKVLVRGRDDVLLERRRPLLQCVQLSCLFHAFIAP
jgi:hypothetical protein